MPVEFLDIAATNEGSETTRAPAPRRPRPQVAFGGSSAAHG